MAQSESFFDDPRVRENADVRVQPLTSVRSSHESGNRTHALLHPRAVSTNVTLASKQESDSEQDTPSLFSTGTISIYYRLIRVHDGDRMIVSGIAEGLVLGATGAAVASLSVLAARSPRLKARMLEDQRAVRRWAKLPPPNPLAVRRGLTGAFLVGLLVGIVITALGVWICIYALVH
jgi:hypothetical protein